MQTVEEILCKDLPRKNSSLLIYYSSLLQVLEVLKGD